MYYTDDALFPENMQPLIITAAPMRRHGFRETLLISPSAGTSRSRQRKTATAQVPPCCTSTCATQRQDTCRPTLNSSTTCSADLSRPFRR